VSQHKEFEKTLTQKSHFIIPNKYWA